MLRHVTRYRCHSVTRRDVFAMPCCCHARYVTPRCYCCHDVIRAAIPETPYRRALSARAYAPRLPPFSPAAPLSLFFLRKITAADDGADADAAAARFTQRALAAADAAAMPRFYVRLDAAAY